MGEVKVTTAIPDTQLNLRRCFQGVYNHTFLTRVDSTQVNKDILDMTDFQS